MCRIKGKIAVGLDNTVYQRDKPYRRVCCPLVHPEASEDMQHIVDCWNLVEEFGGDISKIKTDLENYDKLSECEDIDPKYFHEM